MTFDDYVDGTARPATEPGFSPARGVPAGCKWVS